jgi:hypothetical protein
VSVIPVVVGSEMWFRLAWTNVILYLQGNHSKKFGNMVQEIEHPTMQA